MAPVKFVLQFSVRIYQEREDGIGFDTGWKLSKGTEIHVFDKVGDMLMLQIDGEERCFLPASTPVINTVALDNEDSRFYVDVRDYYFMTGDPIVTAGLSYEPGT